ncbi:MAG: CHRD domain-containing protein [Pedosphaera sp.]|nr:CHRD domain-containing protein [Pedosphaera sp.]
MPGAPATDGSGNGMAAEIITYLDLPAGEITMGVNSDDGFHTTVGPIGDPFKTTVLGQFDGGRGAGDTTFKFTVVEAGIYPFRTTWEQGGGDANVEWFTVKADATKVLVNDIANGGVKAYRAATAKPLDPAIKSVKPPIGDRQLAVVASTVSVVLVDGDVSTIDDASIDFKVDGKPVASKVRSGKTVTLTYAPVTIQFPGDKHAAELTFKASGGFSRTEKWNFRNLKNVVLPTAALVENFDSTVEGTQPKDWVATNFTLECTAGDDIADQKSDTYKNWVVISTDTIALVDDDGILEVNPSEKLNGKALKIEDLRSGNVLYAESDGRCNGTRATVLADKAGIFGQTQIIVSKPYNLSAIKNPVLSFGSGYEQNQDSYGGVEYSVDGGKTWLPVVYFLDGPDILVNPDGTTDGVGTLNTKQGDSTLWTVDGVLKGEAYGDVIAAPIDAKIADYIAPRVNDDHTEGKRIEIFRLPAAAQKADVRLRLSATGSDSWYFFVDNISFYDIADTTVVELPITGLKAALSDSDIVLSWVGGTAPFLVQGSQTMGGSWIDLSTTSEHTAKIPPVAPVTFYRIQDKTTKTVKLYKAVLNGAREKPTAVVTAATGLGLLAIDGTTATYLASYQGLGGAPTAWHLHRVDKADGSGGVFLPFTPVGAQGTAGYYAGQGTISAADAALVEAGKAYFNVHTAANPGGEIRGDLVKP